MNILIAALCISFLGFSSASYAKYDNPIYSMPTSFLDTEVQLISFSDKSA